MRTCGAVCALVALVWTGALAQQPSDTAVTVQGFLQEDEGSSAWTLVVPLPVEAFRVRTFALALVGKADRWSDLRNLFVEAQGRVSRVDGATPPGLGIAVDHMRETKPPGMVERTVDHGVGTRTRVQLAVIPRRFAWRDEQGRATGVNPVILYTLLSERLGAAEVIQPTDLNFCLRAIRAGGVMTWDSTVPMPRLDARRFATQGGAFREGVQLPEIAARNVGHYVVIAGVCENDALDVEAEFEVQ